MKLKNLLASSLGNILEWFDFGFFIFMAPILGKQFFPVHDTNSATLAAFGVFAAGFICRPLGGILFGHLGDRNGRSTTLRLSILMITIITLLIGILPTYQKAGMIATIIFTLLRMLQGLSVGGEYTGITIYLAESATASQRGFFTCFALIGVNLGFLLATLTILILNTLLSESALNAWGWRIPFIIIGLLGLLLFYTRLKLSETPVFNYLKISDQIQKQPLLTALRFSAGSLLKILGLTCISASFYYVLFGYMPNYLQKQLGMSSNKAFAIQAILLMMSLFLVPLGAILGDRFGRKNILLLVTISIILLIVPCFYLLVQKNLLMILFSLMILTLLSSFDQGNSLTMIVENCPTNVRYSGISLSYNVGNALFGGTAPMIVGLLIQHFNPIAPAYYLMLMSTITLGVVLTLKHTHKIDFLNLVRIWQ